MNKNLAKIWARRIHAGTRTLEKVEERYGAEGVTMVQEAYFELYGEELDAD